ncbi:alcohol dehydrogenase catalytic domain-containing protein [Curtobacterium flaccumfaciens]|nr:alcohol dehydrogenase catalytic domain-containing protein [Curtobacterium flaccumfaciens]
MKAIVAHAAEDLRVDDLPEPEPGRQQVLVRIVYGGVCGSDLHYARNAANGSYRITEPLTLGHEVVGVVERVGPDVRDTYAPALGSPSTRRRRRRRPAVPKGRA